MPEAIRRGVRHNFMILDNGSTHAPKQLQAWLNQKQQQEGWSFTVQVVWLPTYASWLDQIEIWFSILQRKLLTPNHFPNKETLHYSTTGIYRSLQSNCQAYRMVIHSGTNEREIRARINEILYLDSMLGR